MIWSNDRWLVSAGPPSVNPVTVLPPLAQDELDRNLDIVRAALGG